MSAAGVGGPGPAEMVIPGMAGPGTSGVDTARVEPTGLGTRPGSSLLARLVGGHADDAVAEAVLTELHRCHRPVSLPGLCNALWFDRGPSDCYDGAVFTRFFETVPSFAHGFPEGGPALDPQPAVPLGAIVRVVVGDDEAYGEVVWKEGAHNLLSPAWVPSWLAGAPSGLPLDGSEPGPGYVPPTGSLVLRERMVLDFNCLGEELAPVPTKLARLRARGRRLDRFGHIVADVEYPDGLEDADEVGFWASWAASTNRAALEAAGVPADAGLLVEAASVLAAWLDERADVRAFGPYYLLESTYADALEADRADGALGRTMRGLAYLPHHQNVAWASMSARLADTADPATLVGTGWPLAVTAASLLTLDTLASEAPDGDWNGVHLRLDDAWQGGGLWRTEPIAFGLPVNAGPELALGLGWLAYTGGEVEPATGPQELSPPEWYDEEAEDELVWDVDESEASWLTHLSRTDVDTDRLRLPPAVAQVLQATLQVRGQRQVLVVLRHDGEEAEQRVFSELGPDGHLDFAWPLGLWPGATVRVSWGIGGTVLVASTTLLSEPEVVAGITYTHVFNLAVALAAAGLAERGAQTASVAKLVRAAINRHGQLTADGAMCLSVDEVVNFCFGPDGQVVPGYRRPVLRRAVLAAVGTMSSTGAARLEGDQVAVSAGRTPAGRQADRALLARFLDATSRRLRQEAGRHWVAPSVVNLPFEWRHSDHKVQEWPLVAGTDGLPRLDLAPNQTWRRGHSRGSGMPAAITAELERAKAVLARLGAASPELGGLDEAVLDPYGQESQTAPGGPPGFLGQGPHGTGPSPSGLHSPGIRAEVYDKAGDYEREIGRVVPAVGSGAGPAVAWATTTTGEPSVTTGPATRGVACPGGRAGEYAEPGDAFVEDVEDVTGTPEGAVGSGVVGSGAEPDNGAVGTQGADI